MLTVVLESPQRLVLQERQSPAPPGPGQVLVRVRCVGICGTDMGAYRGRQPFLSYPRILGHELGVEVVALGPQVSHLRPGDRCSVEPYLNCNQCPTCRSGHSNCCPDLQVLGVHIDGGLQEQLILPASKLHRSEILSFDQLALVETLAVGWHAVARARVQPHETALVIGAGPIGLAVVQAALLSGARVLVTDVNAQRLDFCRLLFLDTATLPAQNPSFQDQLTALNTGQLPTVVFDTTGSAPSMQRAFDLVAPAGRLVFVGLVQSTITFHAPLFHRREMTLLATRNALPQDFQTIIQLLESRRIDSSRWITHRTTAPQIPDAFPSWLDPTTGCVKAVVSMD